MSIQKLILRNLRNNLKNYYLYVFALIFSVALYFAFVTLQFDPAMNEAESSVKGAAFFRTASIGLIVIVGVFLLYANHIFIKRRSKEIGLFQLIGMTRNRISCILSVENFIMYFGSTIIGTFLGFSASKFIMMILYKVTQVNETASLHFSWAALIQTLIVFTLIYVLIMFTNYLYIRKQSILSLFRVQSSTENQVKKMSVFEMVIGVVGILFIISGYYLSSKLFGGDFTSITEIFLAMVIILGLVILGTYLFYKGSVSFIMNLIRKQKGGYLNINEVLSLSSLMFRMKSNALLLTIITAVSALAIGLLSLTYITYYSAEKTAENYVSSDFALTNQDSGSQFKAALDAENIAYSERTVDVIQAELNVKDILDVQLEGLNFDPNKMTLPIVSDQDVKDVNVSPGETYLAGYANMLQNFMPLHDRGEVEIIGKESQIPLKYQGMLDEPIISSYFTNGGLPVVVVDESDFKQLQEDRNEGIQKSSSIFIGVDISNHGDIKQANEIFNDMEEKFMERSPHFASQLNTSMNQKQNMGLSMFIVGFLGLTFLITSGCILYFKQMDQGEEEKPSYTILRKLGFTRKDLLRGIKTKQLFNFGIPLVIGLLHSYFAVKSGWFLFGTELWTPMLMVMGLYTVLYSIFGLLSVQYYKKVIKEAL
ncbi:ABC transporter permease [Salinibacillus xinjiangensis]|uniref:FtsX-like permease family protein n=1 Tax=Salinibacillus xinjiangensis TaxID=1229268 RepID=A0A6G1XA23_9BACI|nr:ABC transporter permease [Salinibacillus xinjiangensis]MRG87792.1 FtsX-like permease family protein [Salinibacillus xinjiangensis]